MDETTELREALELRIELQVAEQTLDLLQHEAWPHVRATAEVRIQELTAALVGANPGTMSLEQAAELRGQIRAFSWLHDLLEITRRQRDTLKEQLQEEE